MSIVTENTRLASMIFMCSVSKMSRPNIFRLSELELIPENLYTHKSSREQTFQYTMQKITVSMQQARARQIQSTLSQSASLTLILILPSHLHLHLPSGFFLSGFPTKTLWACTFCPMRATCPPISSSLILSP